MVDIDHSRKSRRQSDLKRFDEIASAIESYLKECQITTGQYDAQANHMKKIEKHLIGLADCPSLKQREIVQVNVLNGISPKELFVLKTIDERHANQFHQDFHRDYEDRQHDLVVCLKTGIFCAAKTASNGWQRCRILRLHTKSVCTAFLFDIGLNEHVKWSDLRILDEKWCRQKPFAIRCSLIDVVSARAIDRCTLQQQQQFTKALQMHETFYVSVNRSGTISSDIFLYYVLDDRFHCVNEIFPSRLSSTDDEDYDDNVDDVDDVDDVDETMLSRSRLNVGAGSDGASANGLGEDADAVMRSAGSTFIVNERSANEVSMLDENQNEAKTENKMNGIEMEDSSCRAVPKQPTTTSSSSDEQRLSKPEVAIVQHIDKTGSIYVNIKKRNEALNRLRFEILKQMMNTENGVHSNNALAWNVDDYCLVYGDRFNEWLRGKIMRISTAAEPTTAAATGSDKLAHVYLRDVGKTLEIPLHKLRPSTRSIQIVQDFAWKLRLAFIEINQRDGQTSWIVKILKKMLSAYDEVAISVVSSAGDQLNVILWGIIRNVRAMLPEKIELTNINEELVKDGYAVALTEFDGINDLVGNLMNPAAPDTPCYDSDNFQPNSPHQTNYIVTDQQMDVNEWLPSEPVSQREFAAYPMHVSRKCVLSILEANQRTVADEMKATLERKHKANELECRDATEWKKEDPCFVRFLVDGKFYRGSVRRVNLKRNTCMVKFIDYGNCMSSSLDNLRKATMFGSIPELSRLYRLDNIRPFTENGSWPEEVRTFCSETVVERHCNVIVTDDLAESKSPDEPILCKLEIFTKDSDLASALVARKMADWIR